MPIICKDAEDGRASPGLSLPGVFAFSIPAYFRGTLRRAGIAAPVAGGAAGDPGASDFSAPTFNSQPKSLAFGRPRHALSCIADVRLETFHPVT